MTVSEKYQALIKDIKEINNQIKLTKNASKLEQLKIKRSELLQIKSAYSNVDCMIEAIKEI